MTLLKMNKIPQNTKYKNLIFNKEQNQKEPSSSDLFLGKEKALPMDMLKPQTGPGKFIKNKQKNHQHQERVLKTPLISQAGITKKAISFWVFLKIMQGYSILLIMKGEEGIKKGAINLSLGCFRYPQTFKKCLIDTEINMIVVKRN